MTRRILFNIQNFVKAALNEWNSGNSHSVNKQKKNRQLIAWNYENNGRHDKIKPNQKKRWKKVALDAYSVIDTFGRSHTTDKYEYQTRQSDWE